MHIERRDKETRNIEPLLEHDLQQTSKHPPRHLFRKARKQKIKPESQAQPAALSTTSSMRPAD